MLEMATAGEVDNVPKTLSSKVRAPPPPKKLLTCNPEDVRINESDIPNYFTSSHRRGLLRQSQENAKEPQALTMKPLSDGVGSDMDTSASQKGNDNLKALIRSDEKLLKIFYGMFYINEHSGKDWKLRVDGFIPVCLLQTLGNVNKPFKIIALQGSARVMEFQVSATTKSTRTKVFVKWNNTQEIMYGARFGKEEQAEQIVLRKMSDPANSANSTLRRMKVSLMVKLPDKQSTVMSVPGLLTMSELFALICKKEALEPSCHQLSLPSVGNRKLTFDSETAVGSLKIREVSIVHVGAALDPSTGDTQWAQVDVMDLVDDEAEESKILQVHLPGNRKRAYCVPMDMTMKVLVGQICSQEELNARFHSLQYVDFKHEFLDVNSTVQEVDSHQLRLMDKRGLNSTRKKSSPELDPSLPLTRNHSDISLHGIGNYDKQRQSSVEELDVTRALSVAEASVNPKRFSSPSLLDDLPENFPGHEQNGDRENKLPNGSAVNPPPRKPSDPTSKPRVAPPRPLPYGSRPTRPPRSSEEPPGTSRGLLQEDSALSPITSDMKKKKQYASSPDLLDGRPVRSSTPEKRRRAAPPPPKPPRVTPPQVPPPPSDAGAGQGVAAPADVKPSTKKKPAPPRPSRPPPATRRRSSGSDTTETAERVRRGLDADAAKLDNKKVPPMFIAPPPPADLPPPIDECETPVGPLADEDLFGRSPASRNGSFMGSFSEEDGAASPLPSVYLEKSAKLDDSDVFLRAPWGHNSAPSNNDQVVKEEGPTSPGAEAEVQPVVPPPVPFSEVPGGSRARTPDEDRSETPPLEPHELEVPFSTEPIALEETAGHVTQDTHSHSEYPDVAGTITVVPPPPPPEHSDETMKQTEQPDVGSAMDQASAIPPPVGFDSPRGDWEQGPHKPLKKLGVDEALFSWTKEPPAPLNAVIPAPSLESEPGIARATEPLPPPMEFGSTAQPEVTSDTSELHLSEPPPSEVRAQRVEVAPTPERPDVTAVSTPHVQFNARLEAEHRVPKYVSLPPEMVSQTKPEIKPKVKPIGVVKAEQAPEPVNMPGLAMPPDVISQTEGDTSPGVVKGALEAPERAALPESEVRVENSAPAPAERLRSVVEPVACEARADVEPTRVREILGQLDSSGEQEASPGKEQGKLAENPAQRHVVENPAEAGAVHEEPVIAATSNPGVESLQDKFNDLENNLTGTLGTEIEAPKGFDAVVSTKADSMESQLYDPFTQPLTERESKEVHKENTEVVHSTPVGNQPVEPPTPPSYSPPREILTSSLPPSPVNSPTDGTQEQTSGTRSGSESGPQTGGSAAPCSEEAPIAEPLRQGAPTVKPKRPVSVPPDLLNFDKATVAVAPEAAVPRKEPAVLTRAATAPRIGKPYTSVSSAAKENQGKSLEQVKLRGFSSRGGTSSFITSAVSKEANKPELDKRPSNLENTSTGAEFKSESSPSVGLNSAVVETKGQSVASECSGGEVKVPNVDVKNSNGNVKISRDDVKVPSVGGQSSSDDVRGTSVGVGSSPVGVNSEEAKGPVQESKSVSAETAPQGKPARPPVPVKRPHSWVGPEVGPEVSRKPPPPSSRFSSGYKLGGTAYQPGEGHKKEFRPVAFSVPRHAEDAPRGTGPDAAKPAVIPEKDTELDVSRPCGVSGKEKEPDSTKVPEGGKETSKPVEVVEKDRGIDVTRPVGVSGKEKAPELSKTAERAAETKSAVASGETSGGPGVEKATQRKKPGILGLIGAFSSSSEEEKPAVEKTATGDAQKQDGAGFVREACKPKYVNPSRGKYAVLFPTEESSKKPEGTSKKPDGTPAGSASREKKDEPEVSSQPDVKEHRQGLSSLSSRQKYNVLFAGNSGAASPPAEASTAQPATQAADQTGGDTSAQQEKKPGTSVVNGKKFEIIFAGDDGQKSKTDSKPELNAPSAPSGLTGRNQATHSGPSGSVGPKQATRDVPSGTVEPKQATHGVPSGTVGPKQATHGVPSGTVGPKQATHGVPSGTVGPKQTTHGVPSGTVGPKQATHGVPSDTVGPKPVAKSEPSGPVPEVKKKIPPAVGAKPSGNSLKRLGATAQPQQPSVKPQTAPVTIVPKATGTGKSLKLKMMTKDASRDTDVVPRGLVASLKARRAQEETSDASSSSVTESAMTN